MDLSSPPALEHPPAFLDAVLREPVTAGEDLPVDARDLRPELSDRLVASDRPFEFLLLADPEFADPSPAALALDEDCGLMRLAPRAAAALLPAASAKELEASLYYRAVIAKTTQALGELIGELLEPLAVDTGIVASSRHRWRSSFRVFEVLLHGSAQRWQQPSHSTATYLKHKR